MNKTQKKLAKKEAGKLIVEGINDFLDRSISPVEGGKFKRKKADGSRSILFEEGTLRDSIKSKPLKDQGKNKDEIEVGVFKKGETPIAYNHNKGDTIPKRQFIPGRKEDFHKKIMDRVDRRIKEIKENKKTTSIKQLRTSTIGDILEGLTVEAANVANTSEAGITLGNILRLADDDF